MDTASSLEARELKSLPGAINELGEVSCAINKALGGPPLIRVDHKEGKSSNYLVDILQERILLLVGICRELEQSLLVIQDLRITI